ncbi:hypothetical protein ACWGCW_31105 [Streptomyces sp. NPDC054933]
MTVLTGIRIKRTAVPWIARLRRFAVDALARFADAPLHSPVLGALRPSVYDRNRHHAARRTCAVVETTADLSAAAHPGSWRRSWGRGG